MPGSFLLPLILGLPLLGAIFVMCTPKTESSLHRGLGITFTTLTFLVSLLIFKFYNPKFDGYQLVFDAEWIPGLNAHFKLGIDGTRAVAHQVLLVDGEPRGRVVAIESKRVLLATGSAQRLPVFPGNRLPGVIPAIEAYHLAKRYGAALGPTAIVATQSNYGYRLALRLHVLEIVGAAEGHDVLRLDALRREPEGRLEPP